MDVCITWCVSVWSNICYSLSFFIEIVENKKIIIFVLFLIIIGHEGAVVAVIIL